MQPLYGHTSPETAYIVADYPYGFRLRTQIRYWIETKAGYGQRMVSQTRNPKTGRWNSPKAGTYSPVLALCFSDQGHVESRGLPTWAEEPLIAGFEIMFPALTDDPYTYEAIRHLRAANRAAKRVTWSIHDPNSPEPPQTLREQAAIMHRLTQQELWADTRAAIQAS